MSYITKNQPIGIDIVINSIIEDMHDNLIKYGWGNYQAYHRCYKNPKESGDLFVPEAFIGLEDGNGVLGSDYGDVLLDDKQDSTSFFLTGDTTTLSSGGFSVPVSVIFQINTETVYNETDHYADEEARNDAIVALSESGYRGDVITGYKNVYTEFDTSAALDDMKPYHVFRINFEVPVYYDCNYYCKYPKGEGFQFAFNFGLS